MLMIVTTLMLTSALPMYFYLDADNDGYGNSDSSTTSCGNILPMYVSNADDCNDADAAINPDTVWYADADSDGYGDSNSPSITACVQPNGYVTVGNDCNDSDASTNPGAVEVNDGFDNDCDGDVDETPGPPTFTLWICRRKHFRKRFMVGNIHQSILGQTHNLKY